MEYINKTILVVCINGMQVTDLFRMFKRRAYFSNKLKSHDYLNKNIILTNGNQYIFITTKDKENFRKDFNGESIDGIYFENNISDFI